MVYEVGLTLRVGRAVPGAPLPANVRGLVHHERRARSAPDRSPRSFGPASQFCPIVGPLPNPAANWDNTLIVGHQGVNRRAGEFGASVQEFQFDEEGGGEDPAAQSLHERGGGGGGAARGEQVVNQQDPRPGL